MLFDKSVSVYFFEQYIYIVPLEMASPGNQHCARCIGTPTFAMVRREMTHAGSNPAAGLLPLRYSGQLSLLSSVGREMTTGQSAVMLCGWRAKAGWTAVFTARRSASAVYAVATRLSVCLSITSSTKSAIRIELDFGIEASFHLSFTVS